MAVTVGWFAFRCENREEYWQFISVLMAGMTIFLLTSVIYPNGHQLRPMLSEGNIFVQAVKLLYRIDTPTNTLPSIHVFNALTCCIAVCRNLECRKKKWLTSGTVVLTVLIILSTMFLKQHSVVDVVLALVLYVFCYQVVYKIVPQYRRMPEWKNSRKVLLNKE
jgi:membrane-associated phospholipid phosphatase